MKKNKSRAVLAILFVVWIMLWINFMTRDLIKRSDFRDYKALIIRDASGKRSYTYGDCLFEFLDFCKGNLPEFASYDLIGIEGLSLAQRRAIYYLYPYTKKENANFLLVFNKSGFKKDGYALYRKLDNSRFILKRT